MMTSFSSFSFFVFHLSCSYTFRVYQQRKKILISREYIVPGKMKDLIKETNINVKWSENRRTVLFFFVFQYISRCKLLFCVVIMLTTNTTDLEEIIWCSSCHVRFTTSRCGIELEAAIKTCKLQLLISSQKVIKAKRSVNTYNENFRESSSSINAA